MEEKLAELVGILLGDGSINKYESEKYSTYYRVKITTHSDDTIYIEYISQLFRDLFDIKPIVKKRPKENTKDICSFKKKLVEFFVELGLMLSPKWNRAIIPSRFMNKKLGKFVLRGYFDTDGSVVITKNNRIIYPRLEMKISPSPMQDQFRHLLEMYNIRYKSYDIGKGKARIQINGKQELKKWIETIGFSNPKHSMKSEKFL